MTFLLFAAATAGLSMQALLLGRHTRKNPDCNPFAYSVMVSVSVFFFFFVYNRFRIGWDGVTLLYGAGYAAAAALCHFLSIAAYRKGSVSLTALFLSYSMTVPTLYGLLFRHEKLSLSFALGFGLLIVTVFLSKQKKAGDPEKGGTGMLWLLCALCAAFVSGMTSVLQSAQQSRTEGAFKSEFMMYAMFFTGLLSFVLMLVTGKKNCLRSLKASSVYAVPIGLFNGITNLTIMLLLARVSVSVLFPVVKILELLVVCAASLFLFREKPDRRQIASVVLGAVSIVLLTNG